MKLPTYLLAHDPLSADPAYRNGCAGERHALALVGSRLFTLARRASERGRPQAMARIVATFDRVASRLYPADGNAA